MSHGWLFTFHYASTLSEFANQCGKKILIYIPLCFYFIEVSVLHNVAYINLHSTMLLLYRGCAADEFRRIRLIYIPLCFYFIACLRSSHILYSHLHSTMLLLYLGNRIRYQRLRQIYIPLCFYFIPLRAVQHCRWSTFTFHYASTLSDLANRLTWTMIRDLHSTMLLLYRSLRTCECGDWNWIYIPLCFYFISRQHKMAVRYLQIYIPLCFYFILSLSEWMRTLLMNLHSTMLLLYRGWLPRYSCR